MARDVTQWVEPAARGAIADEERDAPGLRHPPHILWAIGIAALAVAVLLAIGRATGGLPFAADRAIVAALRVAGDPAQPIGPEWLHAAMVDVTALGGTTVLTLAVIGAAILLATRALWWTCALMLAATFSGSIAVVVLKQIVSRPRPALVDHLVQVSGMSFPSGHAANSSIVYLSIAVLASQVLHGRGTRTAILALTVMLVGAIGISRVYLGVHWPSDVLAGWSFGALWALAWWRAAAWIRHRAR